MKPLIICAGALALLTGSALAEETTVIHRDGPDADRTVVHRSVGPEAERKVITRDGDGCASKTVKKSNDVGDSVSKTVSNC